MENDKSKFPGNAQYFIAVGVGLITIISTVISLILYDNTEKLNFELAQRDSLISQIRLNDSLYSSSIKGYSEVITKYVSNCNITIDGRRITTEELAKMVNQMLEENATLKDSLLYYEQYKEEYLKLQPNLDSLSINRKIVELVKRDYGVSYEVTPTKTGNYYFKRNFSRADSALIIFPYFRDKITTDTTTGNWIITTGVTTGIKTMEPATKKRRKKE